MKVAFIGLGTMGSPMAVNIARVGMDVVGHNRTPGRDAALRGAGGLSTATIAAAVGDAEVVALMLPDAPDVESVLCGPDGVLQHAPQGSLVIDFSSISPHAARRMAKQALAAGLEFLDAPVSGGEDGATNASLSIMVGGTETAFIRGRPVLDAVGRTVVRVGESGAGQTVKAANQLIVACHIQALSEALVFLNAAKVELDPAIKVLAGGLAGSAVLTQKVQKMRTRDFRPGFRIDLHHKDLGNVAAAARDSGVVTPLGSLAEQLMASARACGDGGLDHSALLKGVERLSGFPIEEL